MNAVAERTGPPPALDARGLRKTFVRRRAPWAAPLRTQALDEVSLRLEAGRILGIVGESGSGKSTLGRIIAGLDHPDAGELRCGGIPLVSPALRRPVPAARRGIGMIFQDPYASLNPRMRALDIVGEGLRIAGMSSEAVRRRVDDALGFVGLRASDRERYPHQFSGGQRQRLGIARALVMEPRLLIADEAVSSLDVSVQMQVLNLLLDIREQLGTTLIFISHNIGVVDYLCDDIAVLWRGRIVEGGAARAVIDAPRHAYTQRLLAAVPRLPSPV